MLNRSGWTLPLIVVSLFTMTLILPAGSLWGASRRIPVAEERNEDKGRNKAVEKKESRGKNEIVNRNEDKNRNKRANKVTNRNENENRKTSVIKAFYTNENSRNRNNITNKATNGNENRNRNIIVNKVVNRNEDRNRNKVANKVTNRNENRNGKITVDRNEGWDWDRIMSRNEDKDRNKVINRDDNRDDEGNRIKPANRVTNRNENRNRNTTVIPAVLRNDYWDWNDHVGRAHRPYPRGRIFHELPSDHRRIRFHEIDYFYYAGLFFFLNALTSDYVVVEAPIGAVVLGLPIGYSKHMIHGSEYFFYNGVYYQKCSSGYIVVKSPELEGTVSVETWALNVRSEPFDESPVVSVVFEDDLLQVYDAVPGWLYVRTEYDEWGWVMARYTEELPPRVSG